MSGPRATLARAGLRDVLRRRVGIGYRSLFCFCSQGGASGFAAKGPRLWLPKQNKVSILSRTNEQICNPTKSEMSTLSFLRALMKSVAFLARVNSGHSTLARSCSANISEWNIKLAT